RRRTDPPSVVADQKPGPCARVFCCGNLGPHPEEARSAVSKDGSRVRLSPQRISRKRHLNPAVAGLSINNAELGNRRVRYAVRDPYAVTVWGDLRVAVVVTSPLVGEVG